MAVWLPCTLPAGPAGSDRARIGLLGPDRQGVAAVSRTLYGPYRRTIYVCDYIIRPSYIGRGSAARPAATV